MSQPCLIVGSRGFVGSAISGRLQAAGHELLKVTSPRGETAPDELSYATGLYDRILASHPQISVVFYCAGTVLPRHNTPLQEAVQRDVEPLTELLAALLRAGRPSRVVLLSSAGAVYGPTPPGQTLSETSLTKPVSVYGHTRLRMEETLRSKCQGSDLEPVVLRVSNLYGPGQRLGGGSTFILTALTCAARGTPFTLMGGNQKKDFLYLDDFLELTDLLVAPIGITKPHDCFNICRQKSHGLREVLRTVERATERTLEIVHQEPPVDDVQEIRLSSRAPSQLSWKSTTTLEEGVARFWSHLQQQGGKPLA